MVKSQGGKVVVVATVRTTSATSSYKLKLSGEATALLSGVALKGFILAGNGAILYLLTTQMFATYDTVRGRVHNRIIP